MYKVTLFFKSGNQTTFQCRDYKITYNKVDREYSGYEFDGLKEMISFSPPQLEAYVISEVQ